MTVNICTWNMRGANDNKWREWAVQAFDTLGADVLCLQECGAPPPSAVAQQQTVARSNAQAPYFVTPYIWNTGTASRPRLLYLIYYNSPNQSPGSRVNLAIVTRTPPTQWWFVTVPYPPSWRPALGLTLPTGEHVFSVHAISGGGVDAVPLVAGVASMAASVDDHSWLIGGDFNRAPDSWGPNPVNVSPPDGPTWSNNGTTSVLDYVVSSSAQNQHVTGEVQDVQGASDHQMVSYTALT